MPFPSPGRNRLLASQEPGAHQVRYHGILAPSASQRDRVVPSEPARVAAGELPGDTGQRAVSFHPGGEVSDSGVRIEAPASPKTGEPDREEDRRRIGSIESARRMRWAALLQRVFEVDALRCPRCASTMRLIAAIEDPAVAKRILERLKLPARAPPLGSATAEKEEPERDWFFDQAPTHEEA